MNAYPPPRYVAQGIFRLLPHPIYTGFTMLCVGVSIAVVSASGLWLVSPIVALSCAARVLGYERHDLRERLDRKSTRLNSSHGYISYAVLCLKKKKLHALRRKDGAEPRADKPGPRLSGAESGRRAGAENWLRQLPLRSPTRASPTRTDRLVAV